VSVVNGSPDYQQTGKIGEAVNYDGSNEYHEVSDAASLDVPNITFELWMKFDTQRAQRISGKYGSAGQQYLLCTSNVGKDIGFCVKQGANSANGPNALDGQAGVWLYVTGTYDGTTQKVFLNAVQKGSDASQSGNIAASSAKLGIGDDDWHDVAHFDGEIDEVRVSDMDRGQAWIKATYESGRDHLLAWGGEVPQYSSYKTMVGNATAWAWNIIYSTDTANKVRSGTPSDWTWRTWEPGSGRKVPQGTADNWTWGPE